MAFGRKGLNTPQSREAFDETNPGHRNVLEHLDREEADNPQQRTQLAGNLMFDQVYRMLAEAKGARIEDLAAIIASVGGFFCAVAAMKEVVETGIEPAQNDIVVIRGNDDGLQYMFGDLPNKYLLEDKASLLSLALGAAVHVGANVTMEDVHEVMKHVAGTAGTNVFGRARLSDSNMPVDTPQGFVMSLFQKIGEGLDLYEVPYRKRPEAMGFALQQVFDRGQDAIDPDTLTKIVLEYSVPAAKIDPGDLQNWQARFGA